MTIHEPILTNKTELKFFGSLAFFLLILFFISFIIGNRIERGTTSSPAKIVRHAFDSISLTAKAAYVYDVRTKEILYAKNSTARLPLASLTKVMTAVVATDLAPAGTTITITDGAIAAEGNSGLHVGEKWTLKNLLDFSLTTSSNDGIKAVALALGAIHKTNPTEEESEKEFITLMNKKADELEMKNTYYFNETGLDVPAQTGEAAGKGGAYGSAEDMAKLFSYIISAHPDLLEATRDDNIHISSLNTLHKGANTDKIVSQIPGIKASKTGFTDIAGGNLVIAFDPELGRPIIISVLGSTEEGRFVDVSMLVEATLRSISEESEK